MVSRLSGPFYKLIVSFFPMTIMKYHIFKRNGEYRVYYEGRDVDMQRGIIEELGGDVLHSGEFDMNDGINYFGLIERNVLKWANETGEFDAKYIEYLIESSQNSSLERI